MDGSFRGLGWVWLWCKMVTVCSRSLTVVSGSTTFSFFFFSKNNRRRVVVLSSGVAFCCGGRGGFRDWDFFFFFFFFPPLFLSLVIYTVGREEYTLNKKWAFSYLGGFLLGISFFLSFFLLEQ